VTANLRRKGDAVLERRKARGGSKGLERVGFKTAEGLNIGGVDSLGGLTNGENR